MIILPIEQWRNGDQLVDPTGARYDPNMSPTLIRADTELAPDIDYAREHARRIGITLLCSLQEVAADLGAPGEFEARMRQTDIYGGNNVGYSRPGSSYDQRVEGALAGARDPIQVFNTMDWDDGLATLGSMQRAVDNRIASLTSVQAQATEATQEIAEDLANDVIAGEVHLTNHINWLVVATVCRQVRRFDQGFGVKERVNVLIDDDPRGFDIARKFGTLGIEVDLHEIGRASWPQEVTGELLDFGSIMTTGRLDAAD